MCRQTFSYFLLNLGLTSIRFCRACDLLRCFPQQDPRDLFFFIVPIAADGSHTIQTQASLWPHNRLALRNVSATRRTIVALPLLMSSEIYCSREKAATGGLFFSKRKAPFSTGLGLLWRGTTPEMTAGPLVRETVLKAGVPRGRVWDSHSLLVRSRCVDSFAHIWPFWHYWSGFIMHDHPSLKGKKEYWRCRNCYTYQDHCPFRSLTV